MKYDDGVNQEMHKWPSITDLFKYPESWVSLGSDIHLGEIKSSNGRIAITMGIDFGTAFTKASFGLRDKIFIVNWSGVLNGDREFTLPGVFSVLSDGCCILGQAPAALHVMSGLKQPFLGGNPSNRDIRNAAIFLALVIRYVRGYVFHHHMGLVKDKKLIWSLNIGIPSKLFESNRLKQIYHRLALTAWRLSYQDRPILDSSVDELDATSKIQERDALEAIYIIPEFVAQIASYTRSSQRQSDLHMIMDIGSGTVDVATFNVHDEDGEDFFPIFSSAVEPLGTHFLMEKRIGLVKNKKPEQWNDFLPVLSSAQFGKHYKIQEELVKHCDDEYRNNVTEIVKKVIYDTKTRRYRISRNWSSGIRIFCCGGGSDCEVYSEALNKAFKHHKVAIHKTRLPIPRNLEAKGLHERDFHRVAVAYGLGIYGENLGAIKPASEVPDDVPLETRIRERPDRDELYPK